MTKRCRSSPLAPLCLQRWEIELGFRELKQSLQMGVFLLCSKQADWVRQALWGALIAYTLMRQTAEHLKVQPPCAWGFMPAAWPSWLFCALCLWREWSRCPSAWRCCLRRLPVCDSRVVLASPPTSGYQKMAYEIPNKNASRGLIDWR